MRIQRHNCFNPERRRTMLEERQIKENLSWPEGRRIAVMLSFDFQGGEDLRPNKNGIMNHEEWTQAEYGPRTGVWRILRILDECGVKATFLTCGGIAERYPDQVRAIVQHGHEVAGHGYHHEVARDLPKEQEREVIEKTNALTDRDEQYTTPSDMRLEYVFFLFVFRRISSWRHESV